ncbi:RNA polymerase small subunit protein, putative [Babesia bigemina]|uniref:RNA polymerase small subunit protein, putative n=1 Tax=Babesia bigemina TaxID=5866 RepID=A0A061D2E7_BABBI|nr:RNA polymerase small subunit protein, putative [Babesia bigemina]CDR94941.1 RNA polymerase small subunit protein, putative [Babesia bigemina]|eukprot:XP_012767127.1 RNA polymerase small subunit protein, putative [Babesia bigemina]
MDKVDTTSPNITFSIENEDHTLGNTLRTLLVEREDVVFAGYSVPHPMQPEVNIRIQTTVKVFGECLDELVEICDLLTDAFVEAGAESYSDAA